MQKYNLKFKAKIFALFFVIIAIFAQITPVFADKSDLKVYYSEPIGKGEKVFHITTCSKTQSYVPLKCSEQTQKDYPKQCLDEKNKLIEGKLIKGCVKEGVYIPGTTYLDVDTGDFDAGKCKDSPELQGFKYAPEWAIVYKKEAANELTWESKGTMASKEAPDEDTIKKYFTPEAGQTLEPVKLYRPTLCAPFDQVPKKAGADEENMTDEDKKMLDDILKQGAISSVPSITDKECNRNNSTDAVGSFPLSTPFNDKNTYSCTILERITGKSGVDIFAKYVGRLYAWIGSVVGIIAVLIMVYSGVQISMAGGDTGVVEKAKNRIMEAILGLIVLFLAGLILYTINPGFFT